MRSWERSQRAVPWVPLPFPPHCSLVPVVPTGSFGAGDRKEQEEKERKCRREAETGTPHLGLRARGQSLGGYQKLVGGMCVWQLRTMLEVCFLQTKIPGATLPEPLGSEQITRDHPGLALSFSRVEKGGAQTPGGGGARTLAQSACSGQTFLTLLRMTRSRDQAGPAVYCHRVSEIRRTDIWLKGLPEPTEKLHDWLAPTLHPSPYDSQGPFSKVEFGPW